MTDSTQPRHPPLLDPQTLQTGSFGFAAVPIVPTEAHEQGIVARAVARPEEEPDPPLGPLGKFVGTFTGSGFNTIFRPQSAQTPTDLHPPVPSDNVLELNLTNETLMFMKRLGKVPNRGMVQGDICFNGLPYLQIIADVSVPPTKSSVIHVEPGLWIFVPATQDPAEEPSVVRMASIPHGTTILAEGTSLTASGPPTIPAVSITPTLNAGGRPVVFPSQTAANKLTARIPQDLNPFVDAGTITQALLDDPNTLLRNHIAGQTIVETTTLTISTNPATPLFGGGAANIDFLLGNPAALTDPTPAAPNAQTLGMHATFWIETVRHTFDIPPGSGQRVVTPPAAADATGGPRPTFSVEAPDGATKGLRAQLESTQIQYSQLVLLNFNGLTWPHVSVATLVPSDPIPVQLGSG